MKWFSINLGDLIPWWTSNQFLRGSFWSIRPNDCSVLDWNDSSSHRFYLDKSLNNSKILDSFGMKWPTFTNEVAFFFSQPFVLEKFKVDKLIFGKVVKVQVLQQHLQLFLWKSFAKKRAHLIDFLAQVLNFDWQRYWQSVSTSMKLIYSFSVLVEKEEHIRMVSFCPSFENVGEKGRIIHCKTKSDFLKPQFKGEII